MPIPDDVRELIADLDAYEGLDTLNEICGRSKRAITVAYERIAELEEALRAMMNGAELLAEHYAISLSQDVSSGSAYAKARAALGGRIASAVNGE